MTLVPDSGSLRLQLVDVALDNPLRTVAITAFDSKLVTDSFKNSFITININNRSNLNQGKYHLTFNLFKTKPATPPEPLYVDLVVKPATLAPVSTLVVSLIQPFFGNLTVHRNLTLFETSHNSILSPVTIRGMGLADATGKTATASVRFKNGIAIPSGRQGDLNYEIKGDLPIVPYPAIMRYVRHSLPRRCCLKMEITTKRSGWWIILILWQDWFSDTSPGSSWKTDCS